jgi:hypothetical protein
MENIDLNETVSSETGLKELVVNYIGERLEFLLAVAEENFLRGYEQALADVETMEKQNV